LNFSGAEKGEDWARARRGGLKFSGVEKSGGRAIVKMGDRQNGQSSKWAIVSFGSR
jgi:hypothetical protein